MKPILNLLHFVLTVVICFGVIFGIGAFLYGNPSEWANDSKGGVTVVAGVISFFVLIVTSE